MKVEELHKTYNTTTPQQPTPTTTTKKKKEKRKKKSVKSIKIEKKKKKRIKNKKMEAKKTQAVEKEKGRFLAWMKTTRSGTKRETMKKKTYNHPTCEKSILDAVLHSISEFSPFCSLFFPFFSLAVGKTEEMAVLTEMTHWDR